MTKNYGKNPYWNTPRKRSAIMGFKESYKKLTKSKGYSIFLIIIGVFTLATSLEVIWSVLIGIFAIALGSYSLYKILKKPKTSV